MYNEVCVGRDTFFKVTQTFYLTSKGKNTGAVANQGAREYTIQGMEFYQRGSENWYTPEPHMGYSSRVA